MNQKKTVENNFKEMFNEYIYDAPQKGAIVEGEILGLDENIAFLDIGASRDAVVTGRDLALLDRDFLGELSIGDTIPVYISQTVSENGELVVSIAKGQAYKDWERAQEALEEEKIVELEVTGYNRGGLQVAYGALLGFVPNSHLFELQQQRVFEDANAVKASKVGTTLRLQLIEVDQTKERLILSAKAEELAKRRERLEELAIGQVMKGTVVNLVNYGAFINLGGVDGLAHISELAWRRLGHPSEALQRGEEIEVIIKDIDLERERVSLSRKRLLPNPWEDFSLNHTERDRLIGTVSNVVEFGVFVRLTEDITGLIHTSALPDEAAAAPKDLLSTGDRVEVEIERIDILRERVGLRLIEGPLIDETPVAVEHPDTAPPAVELQETPSPEKVS